MATDAEIVRAVKLFDLIFDIVSCVDDTDRYFEPLPEVSEQMREMLNDVPMPSGLPRAIATFSGESENVILIHRDENDGLWFAYNPERGYGEWWRDSELTLTGETT